MRKITLAVAFAAAAVTLGACKKTGEGEYQVKTPDVDVNVSTDSTTIKTPSVEMTTDTVNMTVPKVEVRKDTAKVVVPKVKVKP